MIGMCYHSGGMVDKPLEWVIEHLAGIGYDGIEIVCGPKAHIRTGDLTDSRLREVKDALASNGLKAAVINPYTAPNLMNMAKENQAEAERFYGQLMDIAAELGAGGANFLTGWSADGDADAWKVLIKALKPMLERAERMGLTMNIHNHEATTIDAPDKVALLIDHVGMPNLKLLCDITNFHILGSDIAETVHKLGHHIVHCHVKGVKGRYPFNTFLVPGEEDDELDFRTFAEALGHIGYDRYVSVETFSPMREDKAQIAYDMMSATLAKLKLRG